MVGYGAARLPTLRAASLRRRIATLPQVPPHGRMANPLLKAAKIADVAAYIMTLRDHGADR